MTTIRQDFIVSAANISFADLTHYTSRGGSYHIKKSQLCRVVTLTPRSYQLRISIFSYQNQITVTDSITIKSGNLAIGDACYFFSEKEDESWQDFLISNNYLEKRSPDFFSISTGGDGRFRVVITIE